MFFHRLSLTALCAAMLVDLSLTAAAGHAVHRHHPRMLHKPDTNLAVLEPRAAAGSVDVPAVDLSMLQFEFSSFSSWMNSWFSSAESIPRLEQELQHYSGFVNEWLEFALTGSAAQSLPPTVPVSRRSDPGSVEISQTQLNLLQSETTTFITWMGASTNSSLADTDAIKSQIKIEFQAYQGWVNTWLATVTGNGASSSSAAPAQPAPLAPAATPGNNGGSHSSAIPVVSPALSPSATPPQTHTSAPASSVAPAVESFAAAPAAAPPSSPASGGSFNAKAKNNVAVYYGQSPATGQVPLAKLCSDDSVDIIILAFLNEFFSGGGFPTVNFGAACGGQSSQMEAKGATGMLECGQMATDIATCQSLGKKVLLSLGGATGQTAFTNDDQATTFASTLWNLFGGGTGLDAGLRPFGKTTIDGFDVGTFLMRLIVANSLLTSILRQ